MGTTSPTSISARISTVAFLPGLNATTASTSPTVLINCSTPFSGYAAVGPTLLQERAAISCQYLITVHGHQSIALIMESSEASSGA